MLAFLFAAALAVAKIHASQVTMDAKIRDDSDLSQFYQLLEASQVANTTLTYRHVTVFAPTNRAFQKYNGSTKNLVLYHMFRTNASNRIRYKFAMNPEPNLRTGFRFDFYYSDLRFEYLKKFESPDNSNLKHHHLFVIRINGYPDSFKSESILKPYCLVSHPSWPPLD
ncbi:PREDICTED: fasciclin-1-like [Acromyrmex echinatior]|uniref:fasciclin-1-like n=1 Tax=Acromyrmex echinatior TaxID=103372 RepID=UPI000580C518|nr:PREDICTED: fasciclin-1-like [Acromyrmex echinatior]